MTKARKYTVQENFSAHYHIINRCVQRVFLMGLDPLTGISYEHRKEWFMERLIYLNGVFTVEVGGYTLMSNHYHINLKTRPDLTEKLTDSEIANRWFLLYPPKIKKCIVSEADQISAHVANLLQSPEKLKEYRKRLGSLSWFMKSINEYIARKGNAETNCTGKFWSGRFKSKLSTTASSTLAVQTYIDLNPIRAEIADTPENSEYTSAYDRIHQDQDRKKLKEVFILHKKNKKKNQERNMNKTFTPEQKVDISLLFKNRNKAKWLSPFYKGENHENPFFRITQNEYLELLDWTGREIMADKKGAIPIHLKPIFARLEINHNQWIDSLKNYDKWFFRIVGKVSKAWEMLTESTSKWFKGTRANENLFGT